uniref:SAGA-associated factor 11 n=1 Tax=Leersia perrieri TaxID=77586 RepID=A0A0D9WFF4_9ORYZ
MSSSNPNDNDAGSLSPHSQLAMACFEELMETAVADVASECHRIARLGLDRGVDAEEEELRAWAARDHPGAEDGGGGGGGGNKGVVDVFGQTLPAVAADLVDCMNCGRPVAAGRFAPHLEKCMGKGRKARTKTTRSSTAGRARNNNGSAASSYSPYATGASANRVSLPNGVTDGGGSAAGENHSNHILPEP